MFGNYFKTAWRNIWKTKTFSSINIAGLALGIAAFLLIMNYLRFEYSFDDCNFNKDRIYRVPMEIVEKGPNASKPQRFAFTYPAVAAALKKDFPEIEETVRWRKQWGVVSHENDKFVEDGFLYFVDPAVFRTFSFTFEKGDAGHVFAGLNDAVITESTAKKYFGVEDPLGKTLLYNKESYVVKAVVKDLPSNSHINFHILLPFDKYVQLVKRYGGDAENSWGWSDFYTYVLLKPGTDSRALEAKLPDFAQRHMGEPMKKDGFVISFFLQPLKDIHLRSKYDYEFPGNGNFTYLKYLGFAAIFILVIAWINYINLSTARAIDRAKEVGIRKVIGAGRLQLMRQFLTESLLINFVAVLLGLAVYRLSLPYFYRLVGLDGTAAGMTGPQFWTSVAAIFLLGSFLAGAYPSFILSSYAPLRSLKPAAGSVVRNNKNLLRRSLVVVQFFAAIILISGAIGFYRQLHYMSSADLGLNIRQTLILKQSIGQDSSKSRVLASFIHNLETYPGIQSVTTSTSAPGSEVGGSSGYTTLHSHDEKRCRDLGIDNKFISDYGLTVLAGRGFTTDKPGKEINILLNETAVKVFGFSKNADAIGGVITDRSETRYTIIGVIKDFHQESMQNSFDPIVFYPEEEYRMGFFSLKINTADPARLIEYARQQWISAFPESPFIYNFLDDLFDAQYKNDRIFSTVLWLFTLLAIVVASLGLLGLSLYTVAKRRKEISIRKVLGATPSGITILLAQDYLKLILVASLAAIPMAWYVMQSWLKDYAFHISIGYWFVILPVVLIVVIAMSTVVYHSLRAAWSNPVRNLRSE